MSTSFFNNQKKQFDQFLKEFGQKTHIKEYPETHILDFLNLLKTYASATDLKE